VASTLTALTSLQTSVRGAPLAIFCDHCPLKGESEKKTELLAEKTSLAHQLASNRNKEMIDNILRENG